MNKNPRNFRGFLLTDVKVEPEGDAVFIVVNAALIFVGIHNGFYNGKANAGTAVGSCSSLVNFIKAEPYFIQFIFGNGIPFIENTDAYFLF